MCLVMLNLLIFLWTPSVAHAEVFSAVAFYLGTTAVTYGTIAQIGLMIATTVYGAAKERKRKEAARKQYNAGLRDVMATVVDTESPHTYVYGRARVGGTIVAMFTKGNKDQYRYLVCVHAAHECEAIEDIYINGKNIGPLNDAGDVTSGPFYKEETDTFNEVNAGFSFDVQRDPVQILYVGPSAGQAGRRDRNSYAYTVNGRTITISSTSGYDGTSPVYIMYSGINRNPQVRVRKHLGTANDPADAMLLDEVGDKWTADHVLRGYCYTVIRLVLWEREFQGGPPEINVVIKGKKLYDVRTGLTGWSENPALVAYDYLTGPCCRVDPEDLPLADYITAANACADNISIGNRYAFDGAITSDEDRATVLEKIAQSMAGGIVATTWSIYAGKYVAPVMALQQSDIVGSLSIVPGTSESDLFNTVRGQYLGSETGYVATDFKPYANATYVEADGKELVTNIDFPYTESLQRIHNLCRVFTEDQRNGYTVKATFSRKTWALKIGQRVTLTSELFGWSAKVFRVTDKSYSPSSGVELTLKEDGPTIWDEADAVTVDETPNSGLPNPFVVNPLENLACESGSNALLIQQDGSIISRILVTCDESDNPYVVGNGDIEYQWQKIGDLTWQSTFTKGDETQVYLSPVEDGQFYVVRARAVNTSLDVKSDWTYVEAHQVIGKTEPPSAVTGVAVTQSLVFFNSVDDLDLLGYEVRAIPGRVAQWSLGLPIHDGYITDSPYAFNTALQGVQTIMVAAVDTSGNYGEPSYATLDFGVISEFNVAQSYDYEAAGFPGEITNATVTGGDLVADLDPGADFWTIGASSFWVRDNITNFWGGAVFLPVTYIARFTPDYAGGNIILDTTLTGSRKAIKWHVDGGTFGDFWTQGDADFWSGYPSFWGETGEWLPYVGSIESKVGQSILFQVTIDSGPQQGVISAMSVRLQMPDREQVFTNINISASGTRLDPSLGIPPIDWIQIEEANFTIYVDGSGAAYGRVTDFDPVLGPQVETLNTSGVAVNSTGQTVRVRGF